MEIIAGFSRDNRFLSNFFPSTVYHGGIQYSTVEHAYQAAKTNHLIFRQQIADLPASKAGEAKKMGEESPN